MDLSPFLKSVELLSDLNEQELNKLAADAEILDYPAGGLILPRHTIGRALFILYEGSVEIDIEEPDKPPRIVANLERGDIFGEMSILTGEPTGADVRASQPCKVVRIPRETFSGIIAGSWEDSQN